VFGLFVWDRSDATWQITVDNSGLYRVFFDTSGHVCTSFFEIAAARGAGPAALSTDALVEFLLHGCVYAPRTLLPGIRRIPAKLGFARQGGLQATSMRRLSRSAGILCISLPLGDGPKAIDVHSSLRTRARASLKVA